MSVGMRSIGLWTRASSSLRASIISDYCRKRLLICPKCITILYCNLTLFIDIFHFKVLFLCCFGLFYIVCIFPVPKQQEQNSAVKSGHQVAESNQLQIG